jgi:UDP-glucose 4-epimerase
MQTLRANLLPLKSILQYAREKEVPHVVYCSSGLVYKPSLQKVSEEAETGPQSDYTLAKLLGETLCKPFEMENRFVVTILRFSHIYGPGEGADGPIGQMIRSAKKGSPLRISGGGDERLDCLYLQDALRAIRLILEKKPHGIWNVGCGTAHSLKTIADSVSRTFGGKVRVRFDPRKKEHRPYFCLDIRKMEQGLGFKPDYDLKSGLARYKELAK